MNDPGPSSTGLVIDIALESLLWETFDTASALAETAIAAALERADADLDGAEVSVLLCDDAFIQTLNHRWRGQDKPTNVLSFPAAEGPGNADVLGDIAVAFETMAREAETEGKSLSAHFSHLIVHGLLHLIGYDHENETEAEEMEALERQVLASLGIADPYGLILSDARSDLLASGVTGNHE